MVGDPEQAGSTQVREMVERAPPAVQHTCFNLKHYSTRFNEHSHAHHQIVLPLQGEMTIEVEDRATRFGRDTAAAIASNKLHAFKGSSINSFLVLDIPEDLMHSPAVARSSVWDAFSSTPFVKFDSSLTDLCRFIASRQVELGRNPARSKFLGVMIVDALSEALGVFPDNMPARLGKAKNHIDTHLLEPITVADLAQVSHTSESRVYALFDSWLGMSPGRYITRQRMQFSADLLRSTSWPVAAIAQHIGYADQSAFTRAFRREFGQSPSSYRKGKPKTIGCA